MKKENPFNQQVILIDGKCYRVEDFPSQDTIKERGSEAFSRGFAYRYITDLQKRILPYNGVVKQKEFHFKDSPVGIYFVVINKEKVMRIVFPRTKRESELYSMEKQRSVMSAVLETYQKNQFADAILSARDSGGSRFIPPIREDDDFLNKAIKMAIRMKDAPFEPYGKRLESLAVEKNHGMEGTNIKNNTRRGILYNNTMSANKAVLNADTWEIDIAIVLRDRTDAMHPMSEDDSQFVLFPSGVPFKIDPEKLVDLSPLIAEAINQDKQLETDDKGDDDND